MSYVYTSEQHRKRALAAADRERSDPMQSFIGAARHQLANYGRTKGQRSLAGSDMQFDIKGHSYSAFRIMTAYPFLQAVARKDAIQRQYHIDRDDDARLHALYKGWSDDLRSHHFHPRPSHTVAIPKVKRGEIAEPVAFQRHWVDEPPKKNDKPRTLVIDPVDLRCVASAAALVLGAFYSKRFDSCVVGCRPGVGGVPVVAAAEQALRHTGRRYLLMADISNFFPSIRVNEALDLLDRDTAYRHDPDLKWLLHTLLLGRDKNGMLPQGNPLSPLLANIVASERIDRVAKHHGPLLRYVDDILIPVESIEHGMAAYTDIERHLASYKDGAIKLHPKKSVIVDVRTWQGVTCLAPTSAGPIDPDYLGFLLRWKDDDLELKIGNRAWWRLHESLRSRFYETRDRLGRRDDRKLIDRFVSLSLRLHGWLQWYGCCEWGDRETQNLGSLMNFALGNEATFADIVARIARDYHRNYTSESDLIGKLADRMAEAGVIQIRDGKRPSTPAELHGMMVASMDVARRSSKARWDEARAHPVALHWFDGPDASQPSSTLPGTPHCWFERGIVVVETDGVILPDFDMVPGAAGKQQGELFVSPLVRLDT